MEISAEKSKVMTNSTNSISVDISVNGQMLEKVTSFKYLGATLYKDDSPQQMTASRLSQQWQQWPD